MDVTTTDVLGVFRMYIGLKLHFSSKTFIYYDNFRHSDITEYSMDRRRDLDMFIEVAEKYQHRHTELKEVMISMFKADPNAWIGDIIEFVKTDKHLKRMKNMLNLTRTIERDSNKVRNYIMCNNTTLDELLQCNDDRPILIKRLRPSDEFAALLDFSHSYLSQDTSNPLWKKRSLVLNKYKHLITTNENIMTMLDDLCMLNK